MSTKAFKRAKENSWLGGICAGIAYGAGLPSWLIRLIFLVLVFAGVGFPMIIYILLWFLMPEWITDPPDYAERTSE